MILVTGGTGFVGQEVVGELLALGYKVRLLVRQPRPTTPFRNHPGVEIVEGDALKPETLPPAMAGVKAVVHLIGIIKETSHVTFEQAHTEATRNVLAAAKQAGVTRWVQMSAAGTRHDARSRYHTTKWEAEELVRQSGLDWTLFRPSLIYGYDERDRILNLLRILFSNPFHILPLLNGGQAFVQPVSVREVAHCFAHAIAKEASIGQTYDLVGPTPFSWYDMILQVGHTLGKSVIHEEIPLLMSLRALLQLLALLLPIAIITGLVMNRIELWEAEIAAAIWVALLVTTIRWNQLIVFGIPSGPLLLASEGMNRFTPRSLQCSEQLKMAQEDNVGDPGPASRTFSYVPESFEQGLRHLLNKIKNRSFATKA